MRLRFSVLASCVAVGCMPEYDPILICHNGNCANTGNYEDDTLDALRESLALTRDGRPIYDGLEIDTFLYYDEATNTTVCLFAHDGTTPENAATPRQAAEIVAAHLQGEDASWNGKRFFLKIELKPTVAGSDYFHDGPQLKQHAECALDLAAVATANSRMPVTVIFDSTAECLHDELQVRVWEDPWTSMRENPQIELRYSGPVVPTRACIPARVDIRTFFVRDWRDNEIESIRPVMVWLDARSENTETLKIIRHLRPEFIATSAAPFVRGWIEGYQ